ncbi:hypothetical protein Cch01nite_20420 [Cellulomonas chitinilytica]|uniref:Uncharacterized protein n=1 Tax=Cellulomonas chitinilytica TaxID=398759 RepID=A0A919P106_9CELL|nr:hypothetical protein [Cellulomonas chitinilytica]GIG21318.1 hypothetical protein Cch01nite_20420 [Cellulomonas chitinilytica]
MSNIRPAARARFADSVDLDPHWLATHAPTVVSVARPRWMSVDPYGLAVGDPVLARWSTVLDVTGHHVVLDPDDPDHVRFFAEYGPYSAAAMVGMTGPGDVVLEAVDGECVGLYLTDAELAESRIDVSGDEWRTQHCTRGSGCPGRFRARTAIRSRLPWFLIRLGVAQKAARDCGCHDWYRSGDDDWRCYHCLVGHSTTRPPAPGC